MQIIANDYRSNEILKMVREYLGYDKIKFGKILNKSRYAIMYYESGTRNFDFKLFLNVLKLNDLNFILKLHNEVFLRYSDDYEITQGKILKIIRQKMGYTQKEFGLLYDRSLMAIQQYEYDLRNYDLEFLLRILRQENIKFIIMP